MFWRNDRALEVSKKIIASTPASVGVARQAECAGPANQLDATRRPVSTAESSNGRNRIFCVFDETYSDHGSLVYSTVRLLIDQIGAAASYEVFCQGRYRGPRFKDEARITEGRRGENWPGIIKRGVQWVRRLAVCLHVSESRSRWALNLQRGEEKLLPRLFDADHIQAVVIFAADEEFALRISRLAHIYSATEAPILVVVTPSGRMGRRAAQDLDWLGVCLLRDGDRVADRSRTVVPRGAADPEVEVAAPVFSFLAPEEYPRPFTDPCSQIDWPAWVGTCRPHPKRVRNVVLFIRPDWSNCGSGTAFQNLASWFRERDSLLIDIGIWPFGDDFTPISREVRVGNEQDNIRAALYFVARRSTSLIHVVGQIGLLIRWFPMTVARQKMMQHSFAAKPRLVRQAIRRARISHIYINHYFTYGYARDLVGNRPFLLDTHDIQTVNFIHQGQRNLITRRADRFSVSLRDELEIASKAERLCFFSEKELDLAAIYIDRFRLHYVLPLPKVAACPPRRPRSPARLLIVSSDNSANVQGLSWFFSHVWPIVQRLSEPQPPPTLRICGSIDVAMPQVKLPGVAFVGVVPQLWKYYDDADLVLLPVIAGGGVAIKTLEAILHERAVLGTRHALRGLPEDVVRTLGHEDEPARYAASLLQIVTDNARHGEQLERSRIAASLLRGHSFSQTLADALDAVRLDPSRFGMGSRPQNPDRGVVT